MIQSWQERLWARVKMAPGDQCWEWRLCKSRQGYGFMGRNGKNHLTHRLAWESCYGPIAPGMHVLHKCDNPSCCRPDHLSIGTPADNMRDKREKGRQSRGADYCSAKLNDDQVVQIRTMYATGNYKQTELGKIFGCTGVNIGQIVRREAWAHV